MRLICGFILAELLVGIASGLLSIPGTGESFTVQGAAIVALIFGPPLNYRLRHFGWLSWWHFTLAGAACALPPLFLIVDGSLYFTVATLASGALGGMLFWWIAVRSNRLFKTTSPVGRGLNRITIERHPSLQAVSVLVFSLPLMLLHPKSSPVPAFLAAEIFAVASPLLGVRHPHFWRYQLASLGSQFALLTTYGALCDMLMGQMGDAGMIFIGPFMTPLFALPLAIILRGVGAR